jgi:hypothetical protein
MAKARVLWFQRDMTRRGLGMKSEGWDENRIETFLAGPSSAK